MTKRLKIGVAIGVGVAVILVVAVIGVGMAFRAPGIPHQLQERGDCISCHGQNAPKPYPAWHYEDGYGNDRCTECHQSDS